MSRDPVVPYEARVAGETWLWDTRAMLPEHTEGLVVGVLAAAMATGTLVSRDGATDA